MILICIPQILSESDHFFILPIDQLHVFFGKMSIQAGPLPIFNWETSFFVNKLYELFIYFGCYSLTRYMVYEYFLPYHREINLWIICYIVAL